MKRWVAQAALFGWAFMSYGEGGSMAPDVTTHSPPYISEAVCNAAADWLRGQVKKAHRDTTVSQCYRTEGLPMETEDQLQARRQE